jgi:hypothetical protein
LLVLFGCLQGASDMLSSPLSQQPPVTIGQSLHQIPCPAHRELEQTAEASECVVQEPTQIGLQGRAAYPGFYELKRLRVEHLRGVTLVEPPEIGFEVRGTPEVVGWRLR